MLRPYADLWNREYPDDLRSPEEIASNYLATKPGAFEEHWILQDGAQDVGMVSALDTQGKQPPEIVTIDIVMPHDLEPAYLNAAIDKLEEIAKQSGCQSARSWTSDRSELRGCSMKQRGFRVVQTAPVTRLHLETFDPAPFEERVAKAQAAGIRVSSVAELEHEGFDWVEKLYHATWEMAQDMPQTMTPTQPSLEQYTEMLKDSVTYVKDLMFVALDGDEIVGYSRATPTVVMPELVRTGLSGTVRSHRRRGVVTALKVAAIQRLQQKGYRWLQTDNDETNPMFNLNLELGFKVVWSWLQYEKKR